MEHSDWNGIGIRCENQLDAGGSYGSSTARMGYHRKEKTSPSRYRCHVSSTYRHGKPVPGQITWESNYSNGVGISSLDHTNFCHRHAVYIDGRQSEFH